MCMGTKLSRGNVVAGPVCGTNCLAVHTDHWTQGRKAWAKRLEEDSRSHRNCRHVYSLLAGAAAVAADTCIPSSCSWPHRDICDTAVMLTLSRWSSHISTAQSNSWPSEYLVMCMCSAINDFNCYMIIIYKTWGERAWAILANLLSPTATHSSILALPWWLSW